MANHDVRDMEQRIRDEKLQPADAHASRGRAAFRRLNGRLSEEAQRELFARTRVRA